MADLDGSNKLEELAIGQEYRGRVRNDLLECSMKKSFQKMPI